MTYSYAGKVTENNGTVISELFVTVDYAKFTKGGVNNGGNDLKPGEKPVSVLKDGVIYRRSIDSATATIAAKNDVVAALGAAGYSRVSDKGTYYEAYDKNGNVAYFSLVDETYWTLTVDEKVIEYVLAGEATTYTWDKVLKDAKGTYMKENATGASEADTAISGKKTDTNPVVAKPTGMTKAIVIKTGYVAVAAATDLVVTTGSTGSVTAAEDLSVKYDGTEIAAGGVKLKIGTKLVATVEVETPASPVTTGAKVSVAVTGGKSPDPKTIAKADVKAGAKVTFDIIVGETDITKIEATIVDMPATVTIDTTGLEVPAVDAKGLTFDWTLDKTEVEVPATGGSDVVVNGSVKIKGNLAGVTTFTLTLADNGSSETKDLKWNAADRTANGFTGTGAALTITAADFANPTEGTTVRFQFTISAGSGAAKIKATATNT